MLRKLRGEEMVDLGGESGHFIKLDNQPQCSFLLIAGFWNGFHAEFRRGRAQA